MPRTMLLWTTRTPANRAGARLEFVRFFRLNRWLSLLIAIPLIVAVTLLAIFFFAAFLGLFVAVLAIAALRVWWLRRKLRHSRSSETFEDRHLVIKQARIVEKETDKTEAHVHRGNGTVSKLDARVAR
jgi:membrane protein implicated in regulation of membrane protease activity